ncbi:conjugal transfer protein TrbI, partial [Escherichia coli]|nr:conjugal transfer protein TrbI [Escherichia coli]
MKNNDYFSPDNSPQMLQTLGVKRVNNVPLMIAIGILTLFVVLIALVANKRANAQNQPLEIVKVKNLKKNTMSLANDVVGNHKSAVIPPQSVTIANNETAPLPIPE